MNENRQPVCWVIAGPHGAGKTTFALDYLPSVAKCHNFVNADLIAAGFAPLAPGSKKFTAGRVFLREVRYYILQRQDFGFETTLSGVSYRKLIQDLRLKGWRVEMLFLTLRSLELAKYRVEERVRHGGHDIPDDVLERRFFRSLNNFFEKFVLLPDRVACYCNSGTEPQLIFMQRRSHRKMIEPTLLKQMKDLRRNGPGL